MVPKNALSPCVSVVLGLAVSLFSRREIKGKLLWLWGWVIPAYFLTLRESWGMKGTSFASPQMLTDLLKKTLWFWHKSTYAIGLSIKVGLFSFFFVIINVLNHVLYPFVNIHWIHAVVAFLFHNVEYEFLSKSILGSCEKYHITICKAIGSCLLKVR